MMYCHLINTIYGILLLNAGLAKVVVMQPRRVSVSVVAMATHQDTTIMGSGRSC